MRSKLKPLFIAAALGSACQGAQAALIHYYDLPSFLADIEDGYYLEAFDGLSTGTELPGPLSFGPTNGFGFAASASGDDLFAIDLNGGKALSTNLDTDTLTITFSGNPVTAIGGFFFPTGGGGATQRIALTFSDDSSWSSDAASSTFFVGFTSSIALTSVSITAPNDFCGSSSCYPTLDDLYVGTAATAADAPTPATTALLALGLILIGVRRRPSRN